MLGEGDIGLDVYLGDDREIGRDESDRNPAACRRINRVYDESLERERCDPVDGEYIPAPCSCGFGLSLVGLDDGKGTAGSGDCG